MTKSVLFGAAALALNVTAAGAAPPAVSEQEKTAAVTAFLVCLRDNARKLDDHRSDAATVALALRPPCDAAWRALDEFYGAKLSPAARRAADWERKNAELFIQYATGVVLHERAGK